MLRSAGASPGIHADQKRETERMRYSVFISRYDIMCWKISRGRDEVLILGSGVSSWAWRLRRKGVHRNEHVMISFFFWRLLRLRGDGAW